MEKVIDQNPKVKLHTDKYGKVYAAAVRYKTGVGQDIRVAFKWREWQRTSGSYADLVENYVDVKVKKRAFFYAPTVYSEEKKVGEQLWVAYEGSKDSGHQSFMESMQDKKLFDSMRDDSPLKAFVVDARVQVAAAMEAYYQQRSMKQQTEAAAARQSR